MAFPSDLEIARAATAKPLTDIASMMGIGSHLLEPYGSNLAKIRLEAIDELADRPRAKYVVVTAITPTPLGEGKTTTTVGLGQAMKHIGRNAVISLRQPSMGPTFGIKGGAAGGGYSQVIPMEQLNLHLTGDFHAVTAAHNLLSAMVDNHLHQGNELGLDIDNITWRRVLARLGRIVVGYDGNGTPVTAEQLSGAGSMAVIMRDAIKPNLLQTLENTPVIVHAGPFGNIAHGNSSIIGDLVGIRGGDYLITEAGFGADMGAERFFNIKCRASGLVPDAAVLVTTVRALKAHSGKYKIVAGKALPAELLAENPADVEIGGENLRKQIENVKAHGVTPVVAINSFPTDHRSEHEVIARIAAAAGARVAVCNHFGEGGKGAVELANAVVEACNEPSGFKFLYEDSASLKQKIETVAKTIYGAADVSYTALANKQLKTYTDNGFASMPVCIAKTHLSISGDPSLKGAPTGHTLAVREVRASVGAGFVYPICGEMRTLPGLGTKPAAAIIDFDDDGEIVGLS
ncbi:MAG: formate--tetrahydrofolate ligase [Actinobacteria bacterium]|nr:formate--tetrahydrofolate ligase [Actinomycetota bacterium]